MTIDESAAVEALYNFSINAIDRDCEQLEEIIVAKRKDQAKIVQDLSTVQKRKRSARKPNTSGREKESTVKEKE